jgi:hypothetical protein
MVPQLERVAHPFGVTVHSNGGQQSLSFVHDAFERIARRSVPTRVLYIGDYDEHGIQIEEGARADLTQMLLDRGAASLLEWERIAATPEQILSYDLPTQPGAVTKFTWTLGRTAQAEALPPAVLAQVVEAAIRSWLDAVVQQAVLDAEARERAEVRADVERIMARFEV